MKEVFKDGKLTKENLIELLNSAKQDEQGHWYIEKPQDEIDLRWNIPRQRIYFGVFYTICEDFIQEYTDASYGNNTTCHSNRHFINDDTFDLYVAKDPIRE